MSNYGKFCLFPDLSDSQGNFGSSIAINNSYLAIGNTTLNKVIVYTPNNFGEWIKNKEILPPESLNLDTNGSLFGSGLELDGDVLTISARIKNVNSSKTNFSSSTVADILSQYSYKRYLTNLKTDTEIHPIDLLMQRESESNLIRFNLLREGKIKQFVLPDPDVEIKNLGSKEISPISKIALHKNLLLVGYSLQDRAGGAFLFDLDRLNAEPLKLTVEKATLGTSVAISEHFAVVGYDGIRWYFAHPSITIERPFKTLIKNLNNGLVSVVQTFGILSLSGNILAVMRPCNREQELAGLLEVFRLDENITPHLIRRTNVAKAKVENGFLVTIETYESVKLCVTPLSELQ